MATQKKYASWGAPKPKTWRNGGGGNITKREKIKRILENIRKQK